MHTLASAWDDELERRRLDIPGPRVADDIRSVCHDLRGRLATIGMIASALRTDPDLSDAAERQLRSLLDEVASTTEMVRRVVTGRREVVDVALDALVTECAARGARTTGAAVTCETEPVTVAADRLQLTRLLDNLIDNAVRVAGPDGHVHVRVLRRVDLHDAARPVGAAAVAVIRVEDDGPGFGSAQPGLARLGLEVSRSVVAEAGGTLELGRSTLGGGLVTVTLPVVAR